MRTTGALRRWWARRSQQDGFTIMETVVAVIIVFGGLLALMSTATVGLVDAALARQRQTATGIANQVLEQVRALPYETVAQGLEDTKLAQDPNIYPCPDGEYRFESCTGEKIVHTLGLADVAPLVPNKGNLGPPEYRNTYTWRSYVTRAESVGSGVYRATVVVSWNPTVRRPTTSTKAQTLIYKGTGSTDPSTSTSGAGSFFFGESSLTQGSVKVSPNPGVASGTGVAGLSSWDSISQDLSALSSDIVAQDRTRSETELRLNGAKKVTGGVPTTSGGATSVAKADDDPNPLSQPSSSTPAGVSQAATSVDIAGGGNRIGAGEAAGAGGSTCPSTNPTPAWMTGVEAGGLLAVDSTLFTDAIGGVSADSTVARTGSFSAKVSKASGSADYFYKAANNRGLVIHFAIRLASLPSMDVVLGSFDHQGTSDLVLRYRVSDQKLTLAWGSNAPAVSTSSVAAGTWYSIELKVDTNANPITAGWRLNDVAQPSVSSAETAYPIVNLYWGSGTSSLVYTANYDDFYVSTNLSHYPMGNTRIGRLLPDAIGTNSGAANFRNNDGTTINSNTYQRLDEADMVTLEDYVYQLTASSTSYLEVTFGD
ncbi:MAG TPA: hypothetical protein VEI97_02695, partial [bacterium]|nr:hypothetical protein [bacterium]